MSSKEETDSHLSTRQSKIAHLMIRVGSTSVAIGLGTLFLLFLPIFKEEITYRLPHGKDVIVERTAAPSTAAKKVITPRDSSFGIVIPKINANARVIANVDPNNEAEYQQKLTQGIAHAKGSSLPPDTGMMFLFAHSSVDFYKANRYNSIFYLIHKLELNDDIFVFYDDKKYRYQITESVIVEPDEVSYLTQGENERTIRLMTCWPPGTTHKRLIVEGKLVPNN